MIPGVVRLPSPARSRVRRLADSVPFWFHSIDLGHGVVTPGHKSPEVLASELAAFGLPEDLSGRSVLDIGGWDGYFAFAAERRGAARVAVLDHYMWSLDIPGQQAYWQRCREEGVAPRPYHETEHWQPDTLPGKRGFDVAREALDSSVEAIVADFMTTDLAELGLWDYVLYLGVLYHIPDPMTALQRVAAVTRDRAVIETEAVVIPGFEHEALWRFFPGAELNADVSNWWAPNMAALVGALTPAGFAGAEVRRGPDAALLEQPGGPHHFRAIVQAHKDPVPTL
jgi:tRNA (mo5U34)-methyltransferase